MTDGILQGKYFLECHIFISQYPTTAVLQKHMINGVFLFQFLKNVINDCS